MSITSSALLVELNISVWPGIITDRKATDKTLTDNCAVATAGQFKKNLMAGTSKRKEIADFAQGCRHWHNARTLPWLDRGGRLLPTSLFLDYKTEANAKRDKFNQMVTDFLADYDTLVAQAQQHLGFLFNPEDYPSAEAVRDKFGFRLVFSPVPEAGDFRIKTNEEELSELRQQYEDSFNQRLGEAMGSAWSRLHECLQHMSSKLTDAGGAEAKKRYHDTLLSNAQELCAMLTHLNVAADPALERARQELEQAIFGVDMDDIRIDPGVRADVKEKLDAILGSHW
jgi:hypothetical protein